MEIASALERPWIRMAQLWIQHHRLSRLSIGPTGNITYIQIIILCTKSWEFLCAALIVCLFFLQAWSYPPSWRRIQSPWAPQRRGRSWSRDWSPRCRRLWPWRCRIHHRCALLTSGACRRRIPVQIFLLDLLLVPGKLTKTKQTWNKSEWLKSSQ